MDELLDDDLLGRFMETFYGYGNPDAPLWFIGMEEGVDKPGCISEIRRRLAVWKSMGELTTVDLVNFHNEAEVGQRLFSGKLLLQKTWKGLIQVCFALERRQWNPETAKEVQSRNWARRSGNVCLLELYPLPSQNLSAWCYDKWSRDVRLNSRKTYTKCLGEKRLESLKTLINIHKPSGVVCYGKRYDKLWTKLAGTEKWESDREKKLSHTTVELQSGHKIRFVRMPHPLYQKTQLFESVAHLLRDFVRAEES